VVAANQGVTPETAGVVEVGAMTAADRPLVERIYAEGIATGKANFETTTPSWDECDGEHLADHRLVAGVREEVVGWALLSPVSGRCIYAGVAEVSVYVAAVARGRGVGRQLLSQLVWRAEQAGIFPENTASIALHEACGFRIVGRRQRLGKLAGVWRDVELLERRSEHW
jgi:phosphinothricin acetyltransferase